MSVVRKVSESLLRMAPIRALLILTTLFASSCGPETPLPVEDQKAAEVVVKVNGHPITRGDIQRRRKTISGGTTKESVNSTKWQQLTEQATEAEILDRLLLDAGIKGGIEASDDDVERWMARSKTLMGESQYFSMLEARDTSEASFTDYIRGRIIIEKTTSMLTSGANVDEETLQRYYEGHPERFQAPDSIRLEVITLNVTSDLERLEKAMREGEAMEAVAEDFSVKASGGRAVRTRWMPYDALPESIRDKCKSKPAGTVFSAAAQDNSHLVVRILEKKPAGKIEFDEAKTEIKKFLLDKHRKQKLGEWYDQQIKNADIQHVRG
jgi:parvulin-like peptidyl-prolyl isomerase